MTNDPNDPSAATVQLHFPLDVVDGWPPVAVECLPFAIVQNGLQTLAAPLFVKDLSVDDIIDVALDAARGVVTSWTHVATSGRSTVWLLRTAACPALADALARLRQLGCNTVTADALGVHAIDVPSSVRLAAVDEALASLDPSAVAVAFPSLRHAEPDGRT